MIESVFSVAGLRWPDGLDALRAAPRREPFAPEAVAFVAALSRRIVTGPVGRAFPELAALAHWFRPASLAAMKAAVLEARAAVATRPRGLVFVVAPANVDVLFIYGWLLSLLAGNATIVRVSQKPSAARDAFLALVRELAAEADAARLLADSWLVTYGHDDRLTRAISEACDARLVWGGDATVDRIRAIHLKPVAVEGAFADRFSMAALAARAVLDASDAELAELARRFANDTMWFAQQACSSPRALFWIGDDATIDAARARFWPLYTAAAARFADEPAAMMSRVGDMFYLAAVGSAEGLGGPLAARPGRVFGRRLDAEVREHHTGFGLFVEYRLAALDALLAMLTDKDQTLVVFGIDWAEIESFAARLPNRSLDRIVQPGQATDFDRVWDGMDLFDLLTREVNLPVALRR